MKPQYFVNKLPSLNQFYTFVFIQTIIIQKLGTRLEQNYFRFKLAFMNTFSCGFDLTLAHHYIAHNSCACEYIKFVQQILMPLLRICLNLETNLFLNQFYSSISYNQDLSFIQFFLKFFYFCSNIKLKKKIIIYMQQFAVLCFSFSSYGLHLFLLERSIVALLRSSTLAARRTKVHAFAHLLLNRTYESAHLRSILPLLRSSAITKSRLFFFLSFQFFKLFVCLLLIVFNCCLHAWM